MAESLAEDARAHLCNRADQLRRDFTLRLIVGLQLPLYFATCVLLLVFLRLRESRKISGIMGTDLRIIVYTSIGVYIFGNFASVVFYFYKFILLMRDASPCTYVWNAFDCYLINASITSVCLLSSTAFHVALLLERTVATVWHIQRKAFEGFLGALLAIIIVAVPIYTFARWTEPSHLQGDLSAATAPEWEFCSSAHQRMAPADLWHAFSAGCVETAATLGDLLLLIFNKAQEKRRIVGYSLRRSFALREMRISIRLIFPYSVVHSLANFVIIGTILISWSGGVESDLDPWKAAFNGELFNTARAVTTTILMLFMCLYIRSVRGDDKLEWRNKVDATETYFGQFQKMIS